MLKKLKLVRKNSGKFAATSTIALLGFGLANHSDVQADELLVPLTQGDSSATSSTDSTVVPTTVAEATAVVATNQAELDSTSLALSAKESEIVSQSLEAEAATSEVATLEQQLVSAVAEHSEALVIKSTATSEHLSELASELASTTSTFQSASAANTVAQSAAASQSATATSASLVASEANQAASEAAAKVDELTSLVEAPDKISTDLVSVKSEVSRLEREVSVAEKAVASATATAKADLAKQLAAKQEELSKKQGELNSLKTEQMTVKAVSVAGANKIVLPSTYKTQVYPALKAIENSGWTFSPGYNAAVAKYTNQIESGVKASTYGVSYTGGGVNGYKSIAADKTRYIDPNNLSVDVQNEMAQFVGEILNDVRGQLGLTALTVTKSAQQFATAVAAEYSRTSFGTMSNPHSSAIIGKNAQSVGLLASDNRGYESLGFFGTARTVDQLKNYFYNSIVYMLFNDVTSRYGHTISLLQNSNNGPYYLGVSSTSRAQHIYVIPSANVKSANFSTTPVVPVKAVDNSAKISAVESVMSRIQTEITNLKSQSSSVASSKVVVRAKDKLKKLNQQLATSRQNYNSLSALKTKLAANKSLLVSQLEKAKQTNALRLQEKVVAQDKLTTELKKYQILKVSATASSATVASLKSEIAELSKQLKKYNDPELVNRTQATVDALNRDLEVAKTDLAVNVSALDLLKADLSKVVTAYEAAKLNLEKSDLRLKDLQAAEKAQTDAVSTGVFATIPAKVAIHSLVASSAATVSASEVELSSSTTITSTEQLLTVSLGPVSATATPVVSFTTGADSIRTLSQGQNVALTQASKATSTVSQNATITPVSSNEEVVTEVEEASHTEEAANKVSTTATTATEDSVDSVEETSASASSEEVSNDRPVAMAMIAGATMVGLAAMAVSKKRYK